MAEQGVIGYVSASDRGADMSEQVAGFRKEVSNLYAVLSGAVSAFSLISLITKMFRVGLSPVLQEFVDYYRKFTYFFVDWLTFWVPFQLPDWYRDLYVISFVLAVLHGRASRPTFGLTEEELRKLDGRVVTWLTIAIMAALYSFVLFGFLLLISAVMQLLLLRSYDAAPNEIREEAHRALVVPVRYGVSLLAAAVVTVAYFALNSQL